MPPKLMTLRRLSSVFRSAVEPVLDTCSTASDTSLKHFISSLETSPPSPPRQRSLKLSPSSPKKKKKPSRLPSPAPRSSLPALNLSDSGPGYEDAKLMAREISSILLDGGSSVSSSADSVNGLLVPWFSNLKNRAVSPRRKEMSRERKQKWVFKSTQVNRFARLVETCSLKLGTDATVLVFGKLRRETGIKELNALMKMFMQEIRTSEGEDIAVEHLSKAFQLLLSVKEQGFPMEEQTYGPFLLYLIDMGLVKEFHSSVNVIKDCNPSALARLGYYEMRLYIRVDDDDKVQELCNYIGTNDIDGNFDLRENYLLALCEGDREDNLLNLLDIVDITKISSVDHLSIIFKSLGRLLLESRARKLFLRLQDCDYGAETISILILSYAASIPNLVIEDTVSKFKSLHRELEMAPSSKSYEKLVEYSCDLHKVHLALDVVDQMCEEGLTLPIDSIHSLLYAVEESMDFNLVRRIYSLICHHNMKPNIETFRSMISLFVKMKDFEGAYGMLDDLKKLNLMPTASMYNAILGGYYREKNLNGVSMVLKQMERAYVKPDSLTYSYLIGNCNSEEKIIEYYEEMKFDRVQVSKQVFMALINAYAACGQFQKAKQVLSDKGIPIKSLNEIKSALISALASHGQMSDALDIYYEIKKDGSNPEPKAVISLIEYQPNGELGILLQLLEDLHDHDYWLDGCSRVIIHCIRNKHLRSAVDLLKELGDNLANDELAMDVLFDEAFSVIPETEPVDVQIGFNLLQLIKEEFSVYPSRKCLDFLLSACVKAKDLRCSLLVWKEYEAAGLPYNVTGYIRMYQAFLASKAHVSAKVFLHKIPKDDPHVRILIHACQETYAPSTSGNEKKSKQKKERKIK